MNIHIDLHLHDSTSTSTPHPGLPLGPVLQVLTDILRHITTIAHKETQIMTTVADIKAKADQVLAAITAESSKDDAIIALVTAETQMIADLKKQLADAIASGSDPAALQAVLDSMTAAETSALANAQKVTDAVNANTPPVTPPPAQG